ncbi:MFS transporter [Bacillus testis]|uniref:MFS transporter n=1 Tax=Bacillus testis TaxID=1622072 RepID=UPI00067F1BBE|nr:MFS transporter [Bacillus testis]
MSQLTETIRQPNTARQTTYKILLLIALCHLLNDTFQAVVPAMFPVLKQEMTLTYTQLGMIAFTLNIVASIMQPVVGWYTDKKPMPYALPLGLFSTMLGMALLGIASAYTFLIVAVILVGIGSAVFHPEGSRVVHMAAGDKKGLSQSIYQVGGNAGQSLAPLISAWVILPLGQIGSLYFAPAALVACVLLLVIAKWYKAQLIAVPSAPKKESTTIGISRRVWSALFLILLLIFARSWYISAMTNFFAFYAIDHYGFSTTIAQMYVFTFLAAGALGTFFGGPLSDAFGKRTILLLSMLLAVPFTIILPYVNPYLAFFLLFLIGFVLMSSFSVAVVYAQDLVPGKIGTMSGLTVGLAFGMGAIGSVAIGNLADSFGLIPTIRLMGFLPLLGLFSFFLPTDKELAQTSQS